MKGHGGVDVHQFSRVFMHVWCDMYKKWRFLYMFSKSSTAHFSTMLTLVLPRSHSCRLNFDLGHIAQIITDGGDDLGEGLGGWVASIR